MPSVLSYFNLTLPKIKGIYRKHNLRVRKVKTKSKRNRPAFNYDAITVFGILLYDTKHILDKSALPPHIYDKFKLNPDLPIYEYNIIDVKS